MVLVAACAAGPSGVELPPGTLVLGEVRHVLTRAMVDAGELAPGDTRGDLAGKLRSAGFTDAQIDAGRVVVVRDRIDWNNTVSGIKHSVLKPELVVEGLTVAPGNVVEVEIEAAQRPGSIVRRVRAASLAAGGCYYGNVPVGATVEALGALSLVGPRGSASLYCAGIEGEGWQRPRTYWHKLPGATAVAPASLAPTPVDPDQIVTADAPAGGPAADDMATLMLYLTPRHTGLFFALPVWVDEVQVASLDEGTCDLVRVAPGVHRVVAGTDEKGWLPTRTRRELTVSIAAGERIVLEYRVDPDALRKSERLFESREKWDPLIYHFTQRPATARDSCAIRHLPAVVRP